jgi:hypothetical protein
MIYPQVGDMWRNKYRRTTEYYLFIVAVKDDIITYVKMDGKGTSPKESTFVGYITHHYWKVD